VTKQRSITSLLLGPVLGPLLVPFLLGFVGGCVGVVLTYWTVMILRNSSVPVRLHYFLPPPIVAFLWCALVALLWPKVRMFAVPVGYASVWGQSALFALMDRYYSFVFELAFFSVATFALGHLGHLGARRCFPRRFPCVGSPQEPYCPHCGYGLYYARDRACPDCGKPFRDTEVDMRLAKWEDGVLKPTPPQDVGQPSGGEPEP
jgi:hypothetical protein